jgi:hypothetical protein
VTNRKAVWAVVTALLSLGALGGAAYASRYYDEVRLVDAVIAVPVALIFGVLAVFFGRGARDEHRRTLGRSGSGAFVAIARFLATVALLLALTAALALAVFAVLVLVLE